MLKFTEFAWIPAEEVYWGTTVINQQPLRVEVQGKRSGELPEEREKAAQMLWHALSFKGPWQSFMVEAFWQLKNEEWLREGEAPLTKGQLARHLTHIVQVNDYADGHKEVFFEVGDLFWGHVVVLSVGPDLQPIEVGLEG